MRLVAIAAIAFAVAGCGDGDGAELAAGNSQLSQAQIDGALGPADQSAVEDAVPSDDAQNASDLLGNDLNRTAAAGNGEGE